MTFNSLNSQVLDLIVPTSVLTLYYSSFRSRFARLIKEIVNDQQSFASLVPELQTYGINYPFPI